MDEKDWLGSTEIRRVTPSEFKQYIQNSAALPVQTEFHRGYQAACRMVLFRMGEVEGIMGNLHLTWSNETHDGKCPDCGGKTVLIGSWSSWEVDMTDCEEQGIDHPVDGVEVNEEITGHYCLSCRILTSISVNQ